MRRVVLRGRFLHDLDRLRLDESLDLDTLEFAIERLASGTELPLGLKDHALHSAWLGYREFHLGSDCLVIYRMTDDAVIFCRAGSHAELFR